MEENKSEKYIENELDDLALVEDQDLEDTLDLTSELSEIKESDNDDE